MEMARYIVNCKIEAENDDNGNPRRGWIVTRIDPSDLLRTLHFIDEGYDGENSLNGYNIQGPQRFPTLRVDARVYLEWVNKPNR